MCENEKKKYHSIEMTTGSLWKNILLFSLPLMGSQVLEVLFNLSDVAVVGRFADYMALGAVGSTTLLVTLFTGILIGMGAGVNVRVAHELGAGNKKGTEETIHTSLLLCAITGLLVCAICLLFSGRMLSMMNTKPELIDQAILYMKIYSLGMPAMAVYNFGNGVLSCHRRYETTIDLPFHCRCGQCSSESVFLLLSVIWQLQALQQPAQFLCISLLLW
mgnify:CR=1 FL=1